MRTLILALLFTAFSYGQDISIVHFNYEWNNANAYKGLEKLRNVNVQYAYVEQQTDALKQSIKSVPTINIYKNQRTMAKFEAGLKMKIEATLEDIQETINRLKVQ